MRMKKLFEGNIVLRSAMLPEDRKLVLETAYENFSNQSTTLTTA